MTNGVAGLLLGQILPTNRAIPVARLCQGQRLGSAMNVNFQASARKTKQKILYRGMTGWAHGKKSTGRRPLELCYFLVSRWTNKLFANSRAAFVLRIVCVRTCGAKIH